MPRPLRIEYAGAWHHATNRGLDHCTTFATDKDRQSFLHLLSEFRSRFGVEVHAYCLMGNHYHLLVRTLELKLSLAMQRLDGLYTRRFNKRHDRDGPLFRGRFASRLIESDVYLARAARYVHRNPLRPSMVSELDQYRWSSYPAYVGRLAVPHWLSTSAVLESFETVESFRGFVEDGPADVDVARLFRSGGPVIGTPAFVERVSAMADVEPGPTTKPSWAVSEIDRMVVAQFGATAESLRAGGRGRTNVPRMAAISLSHHYSGSSIDELARSYGFSTVSSAASAMHRLSQAAQQDEALRACMRALRTKLDAA